MRSIGKIGFAVLVTAAAMVFVDASSASAETSTQLCAEHKSGLVCAAGKAVTSVHQVLKVGTIGRLLAAISVLCLGYLVEATTLGLAYPQPVHATSMSFTGCGTGSTHSNCSVSIPNGQQPLFDLLKFGLDSGVLYALSGQAQLVCSNLGLNCLYDAEGMEFEVGGGELIAENTPTTELGGKFFCPDEGLLDAELETLGNAYVLQ